MKNRKISFCFSGWVKDYPVKKVHDVNSRKTISPPENLTDEELVKKIESGEWLISFEDALLKSDDVNLELFDYENSNS